MKLRPNILIRFGVAATVACFSVSVFAQVSETQYELVTSSVKSALQAQAAKVAVAIRSVPDETRKSSLGGLAAFVALKKESAEAQRIRNVLAEVEKARLLRQEIPLAAIDIAISNSADRQSVAIAAHNDLAMAKIATEIAQLAALQRGVPMIPNERLVTRVPASQPSVELPPLPVVDRIYQPRNPVQVRELPARSGGTVR
jgi:hypothetical protein